jgi:uncharacterized protein YndB with AHSA1/START domain
MTRFADGPVVEVATEIAAPPAVVWDLVTDINLSAGFQDEFQEARWLDGDGPALGASFRGHNRLGEREWETTSYVVAYEPEREFGWAVSDRDDPGATWTFRLESSDVGTRLIYHRRLGPGPSGLTRAIANRPEQEEEIIAARDETHRQNMQGVLAGIKATAEGSRSRE